ncbi:MAG: hypothetical protein KY433_03370 [Actinobacteria bacterium]|nr:hypothetical protein [Actinomycetota bacterium]
MLALATIHSSAVIEPERKPVARGAAAGLMLLSSLLVFGAVGALVGTVIGALGILLALGILVGFVVGVAAVRARFPDL